MKRQRQLERERTKSVFATDRSIVNIIWPGDKHVSTTHRQHLKGSIHRRKVKGVPRLRERVEALRSQVDGRSGVAAATKSKRGASSMERCREHRTGACPSRHDVDGCVEVAETRCVRGRLRARAVTARLVSTRSTSPSCPSCLCGVLSCCGDKQALRRLSHAGGHRGISRTTWRAQTRSLLGRELRELSSTRGDCRGGGRCRRASVRVEPERRACWAGPCQGRVVGRSWSDMFARRVDPDAAVLNHGRGYEFRVRVVPQCTCTSRRGCCCGDRRPARGDKACRCPVPAADGTDDEAPPRQRCCGEAGYEESLASSARGHPAGTTSR